MHNDVKVMHYNVIGTPLTVYLSKIAGNFQKYLIIFAIRNIEQIQEAT